eukprot:CAMPEP_0175142140 /NCGR_PEP_ID=MMETSP0087-20121206/12599_1 /TAXON_ID=136419 /ORGANISM="Unknown Unknown, Strain D1" /LENGTH=224 /DNA_ID=CAMNT_0016425841 /DNA_START=9 /DNA_END=683 /DNA_ORIENTATION=+
MMGGLGGLPPLGASSGGFGKPSLTSKPFLSKSSRIDVKKIGLKFNPPTIGIMYLDNKDKKQKKHSIAVDLSCGDATKITDSLVANNQDYLAPSFISASQLAKLTAKLLDANNSKPKASSPTRAAPKSSLSSLSGLPAMTSNSKPGFDSNTDLNKLDEEEIQAVKKQMDASFKPLKPGDPGYVYDKQIEFTPEEDNDWDEEDLEDEVSFDEDYYSDDDEGGFLPT